MGLSQMRQAAHVGTVFFARCDIAGYDGLNPSGLMENLQETTS